VALSKYFPAIILLLVSTLYVLSLFHASIKAIRNNGEVIATVFSLSSMIVLLIIVRYRKRPKYCIKILVSRTAPFSILVRDLDYLSRLLTTLSREYGEALFVAPLDNGAILCTKYRGIINMVNIIDENTSTLLIELSNTQHMGEGMEHGAKTLNPATR